MLRLVADENFNGSIVRGVFRRRPGINLLRLQDTGMSGRTDPEVLEWAANVGRILLTHDQNTIPRFAYERLFQQQRFAGVFFCSSSSPLSRVIEDILILDECSSNAEWSDKVIYLPL